jgi:hypothetical protein
VPLVVVPAAVAAAFAATFPVDRLARQPGQAKLAAAGVLGHRAL